MKAKALTLTTMALYAAAMLILTSCSSTSPAPTAETTSATTYQQGVPGGVVVETHKVTATVTAIEAAKRTVTLTHRDGKTDTVKCGPEVVNFDQIQVGDQLKVILTEELAVSMVTEGASPSDSATTVVTLAPKGAKPGGLIAETVQVTGKVTAIDLKHHKATLQLPDGTTKKVAVRPDVDLTQRRVGEQVVIRTIQSLAISVEKP